MKPCPYADGMVELNAIDVDELAMALADQSVFDRQWLIDPQTGEILFWTSDTGIDGQNPVDLDELGHLVAIDPLPPYAWYQDMVDFAEGISDQRAAERLGRTLQGKGAFRRFKNELHDRHPDLASVWHAFSDGRARVRAVRWLAEKGLVDEDSAQQYVRDNPDCEIP